MAKNVVLILEYGNGGYSCYNDEHWVIMVS